jgi:hypothetical protein
MATEVNYNMGKGILAGNLVTASPNTEKRNVCSSTKTGGREKYSIESTSLIFEKVSSLQVNLHAL